MLWNTMLGENMGDEQAGEGRSVEVGMGRNEYGLFGEAVDDDENVGEASGSRKTLNEIHGDGIPRPAWYRKLLEESERLMVWNLGALAGGAGIHIVLHILTEMW